MGQRPEIIVERVARYTYGVSYARKPFYEGKFMYIVDNSKYCNNTSIFTINGNSL
jgi:hypothetical protein